jgi:hypothetical protein
MDIISLVIGFAIGMVIMGLAIELGFKKPSRSNPASRQTDKWSIAEIANPRIMAEYLGDVDLPADSKLLVKRYKDDAMFQGLEVRKHSGVRGNFILGDDRALILSGPIKKDEVGFWTVEKEIVDNLNDEFERMWRQGSRVTTEEK